MRLYISGLEYRDLFSEYESVNSLDDADVVLILPGGLGTFNDLFEAIMSGKRTILYNMNMYYAPLLKNLFNGHNEGRIKGAPSEYLEIESEKEEIVKKLEEIKNGKINDGETSKLL